MNRTPPQIDVPPMGGSAVESRCREKQFGASRTSDTYNVAGWVLHGYGELRRQIEALLNCKGSSISQFGIEASSCDEHGRAISAWRMYACALGMASNAVCEQQLSKSGRM